MSSAPIRTWIFPGIKNVGSANSVQGSNSNSDTFNSVAGIISVIFGTRTKSMFSLKVPSSLEITLLVLYFIFCMDPFKPETGILTIFFFNLNVSAHSFKRQFMFDPESRLL